MPEKNKLESIVQQKMEDFRLDPDPADWQAIYDRLHPRKRRAFFWWIFPLAGTLLIGGYFLAKNKNENPVIAQTSVTELPSTNKNVNTGTITHPANPKEETETVASIKKTIEPTSPSSDRRNSSTNQEQKHRPLNNQGKTNNTYTESPDQPLLTSETTLTTYELQQVSNIHDHMMPPTDRSIAASAPLFKASTPKQEPKKIPNASTHKDKGWYLGGYAGMGINDPTTPVSMAKSADYVTNLPGGSINVYQSESSKKSGLHYAAGIMLEKKNKKSAISFGLGLQHNSWSNSYTIYKDSILSNGNFFGRSLYATKTSDYSHLALELPVNFSFRIAGKNASSFWISPGLNNVFTLSLNEKSISSVNAQNAFNGINRDSSLTSNSNRYQPQLRLGLIYEHAGSRNHWQISPYMQYGLNSMVKSGEPDIRMLHLGMQFNYYFKKLK